ncbi:hypothetical protein ACQKM9_20420 [Viridibacillus sp. NPDC093762]|uniref:hypothetical protein n=1 Tax=Viridibacillus sp. NPDC093762 TaxID=3390720 RepID=UPI003D06F25C
MYEELLEDLSMGREIHFIYKDESFYIGCGTGQFMFWKFNDFASEIIGKDVEDLLQKVKLDGKLLKEGGALIKIDTIY